MTNTYTQLYTHIVFAVKGRKNLIAPNHKEELYKFITGIVTNKKQKLIVINGMPDHVHILVGVKPNCLLSDLVRDIKANSSRFINNNKWVAGKFEWQNGFGAFSVGHSQLDIVIKYIQNQEEHHRNKSFIDEYIQFLKHYGIDYNPDYIFEEV